MRFSHKLRTATSGKKVKQKKNIKRLNPDWMVK